MEDIEDYMKKWKTFQAHGTEEQILKCWYYPQAIYTFNTNYPNAKSTFHRARKNTKICMEPQKTLKEKSRAGGITNQGFKLHHRDAVAEIGWYWHKKIHRVSGEYNCRSRDEPTGEGKSCWLSSPCIMGTHLPIAGPQGGRYLTWDINSHVPGKVVSLWYPFHSRLLHCRCGLYQTIFLPLPFFSMWIFIDVFMKSGELLC